MHASSRVAITVVTIVTAMALLSPVTSAATTPPPLTADRQVAAAAGAQWLADHVSADGSVPNPYVPGEASAGVTRQMVIALATTGLYRSVAEHGADWLAAHLDQAVDTFGHDLAGALAELILAAHELQRDPTTFGGTAPVNDLVARLEATRRTAGTDIGLFGVQNPIFDGAYRQGLALQALAVAGVHDPAAEQWLVDQQCADGSWMPHRSDSSLPCPATDPANFSGPDTNSTAVATLGLVAAGRSALHDPLPAFESYQNTDAGWSYFGGTAPSDPDSTALVIDAIAALGVDPAAPRFGKGSMTPYSALLQFQIGCTGATADRGGFWFAKGDDGSVVTDTMATVQAVPALLVPRAPSHSSKEQVIGDVCAPTTTTTSSSTTTSTTSARTSTSAAPTTTAVSASVDVEGISTARAATPVPSSVVSYAG